MFNVTDASTLHCRQVALQYQRPSGSLYCTAAYHVAIDTNGCPNYYCDNMLPNKFIGYDLTRWLKYTASHISSEKNLPVRDQHLFY
jgi:hypothetical protein